MVLLRKLYESGRIMILYLEERASDIFGIAGFLPQKLSEWYPAHFWRVRMCQCMRVLICILESDVLVFQGFAED